MSKIYSFALTFPIFYAAAIKDNTVLCQYDAVNVLLVGSRYTGTDDTIAHISPNMTSHYVRGGKPISKEIVANFLDLTQEQIAERIKKVRLTNTKTAVNCLKNLLYNDCLDIANEKKEYLLNLPSDQKPELFLGSVLQESLNSSRKQLQRLDAETASLIIAFRTDSSKVIVPLHDEADIKISIENAHKDRNSALLHQGSAKFSFTNGAHKKKYSIVTVIPLSLEFFYHCVLKDSCPYDMVTAFKFLFQKIDDDQPLFLQKAEVQDVGPFIAGEKTIHLELDHFISKNAIDEFVYRLNMLHLRKINFAVLTIRKLASEKLLTQYNESNKDNDPYKSCDDIDFLAKLIYQIIQKEANSASVLSDEQIKLIDETKNTFEKNAISLRRHFTRGSKLTNASRVVDNFLHHPAFLSKRNGQTSPCIFSRTKIDLPVDKSFLIRFINLYGSSPDRSLTESEVNSCMNFCYNYRNSYIIELFGGCDTIFDTIVHSISPNTCVHMTIMAEASKISDISGVITIRDIIRNIYSYAADENTPLYFSFVYNDNLGNSEYNFRMIYSTKPSPEDDRRHSIINAEHTASLSPTLVDKKLVPEFFVNLPENYYYMMPIDGNYDPDIDESYKAYDAIRKLLVADRN